MDAFEDKFLNMLNQQDIDADKVFQIHKNRMQETYISLEFVKRLIDTYLNSCCNSLEEITAEFNIERERIIEQLIESSRR